MSANRTCGNLALEWGKWCCGVKQDNETKPHTHDFYIASGHTDVRFIFDTPIDVEWTVRNGNSISTYTLENDYNFACFL